MYQAKLSRLLAFLLLLVFVILFFSVIFFKEEQLMRAMNQIADEYHYHPAVKAGDNDKLEKSLVAKVKEGCTLGRSKYYENSYCY